VEGEEAGGRTTVGHEDFFFLDGRPTGPALLKKQNDDWGYQFYRADTQKYKPGTKKRPKRNRLKRLTCTPSMTPLDSTEQKPKRKLLQGSSILRPQ
jgi:hypothetical protein